MTVRFRSMPWLRTSSVAQLGLVLLIGWWGGGWWGGSLVGLPRLSAAEWSLESMVAVDANGQVRYRPLPVAAELCNPWPEELERQFQDRAARIIRAQADVRAGVNTYFENEKRGYGFLMAHVLGGKAEAALRDLQAQDHQHQQWHRETAGIDYYAAFTLKHQMRKYFYFGDLLRPEYRQQMFDGAKRWTSADPLRRPHYAYDGPKPGWGPDAKNSWVDVRSTENLFLMRVTSVYLMAEETGNQETADLYKQQILDYASTLYRVGMGEWDSENYHGHSLAPLLNLYDFAKDRQVQAAAKACLDWMFAAGAVKYYQGAFQGPTKRDYNHPQPFGGSAACMLWVHFGDTPQDNPHWESDEVHLITSAYRPPLAVVKLARKEFARPLEIFASKPHYAATTSFDRESPPEYLETQYVGHSFLMGSLAGGTRPGKSDVNGLKITLHDDQRGAVALQGVPGADANYPGSPMYQEGKVAAENRVAQYRNLAIWLVQRGDAPWRWVVPQECQVATQQGVAFLQGDRTWVALRPLGTTELVRDAAETDRVARGDKARFPGHYVLAAQGTSQRFCGVAIEVGEPQTHASFDQFQREVLAAEVDTVQLAEGVVRYRAADAKWLGFHWNDAPHELGVWRNGQRHDWEQHARYLYRSQRDGASAGVIESPWGAGTLRVAAGGAMFACEVDEAGHAVFRNE